MKKSLAALALALPVVASAADPVQISAGDTALVLVSAGLVLLMTPGLAFFYGGLVRAKNVVHTMNLSIVCMAIVGVLWTLVSYSLAFSPGGSLDRVIGGLSWAGLSGVGDAPDASLAATIPHSAFMLFQAMFAVITPALISGALVERIRMKAYLLFIALWSIVVYTPVAHWVWAPGGWLRNLGVLDFAGGTVVHINAAAAALVGAIVLGKRRGPADAVGPPAQRPLRHPRRRPPLVRVARLQRRLGARRERPRRRGVHEHLRRAGRRGAAPGASPSSSSTARCRASASPPARSRAWSPSRPPRASSGRCPPSRSAPSRRWPPSPPSGSARSSGSTTPSTSSRSTAWPRASARSSPAPSRAPRSTPAAPTRSLALVAKQALGVVVTLAFSGGLSFALLKLVGLVTPLRSDEQDEWAGMDSSEAGERGYILGDESAFGPSAGTPSSPAPIGHRQPGHTVA